MNTLRHLGWSLLLLAGGLLVFVVFSHYSPLFHGSEDVAGRLLVAVILLTLGLVFRRSDRFAAYWPIPFAFFAGLTAISLDYYLSLSRWLLPWLGLSLASPAGLAIEKLESSLLGILVILILNRLAGQKLESLYVRRGNLRLGLAVGLIAFMVMIPLALPVAAFSFRGEDLSWTRVRPWTPWVLLFVLANAADEELIFRGLFIGRLEPLLGKLSTNLVTTVPFVLLHAAGNYASDQFLFLVLQLLPLSLAWCWLMQKTRSLWGSVLFHAAMDIPLIVGLFSTR